MKSIPTILIALAWAATALSGCASTQQAEEELSEAGKRMQAAMKECTKEELTRENAVEQIDCVNKAKIQAGFESHSPYMWNFEQDIVADRASAIEYAEGKIDKETYIDALEKHWADALRFDKEERIKSSNGHMARV
jgi:hypothetical protein